MCQACDSLAAMDAVQAARHSVWSEWLWAELGLLCCDARLPHHPYVVALADGRLPVADLTVLATEQHHVVTAAVVGARRAVERSGGMLREQLAAYAGGAERDLARWQRFAARSGWCGRGGWYFGEDPYPETVSCACLLAGTSETSLGENAARLYVWHRLRAQVAASTVKHAGSRDPVAEEAASWFATDDGDRVTMLLEGAIEWSAGQEEPFVIIRAAREMRQALTTFYQALEWARAPETTPRRAEGVT